MYESQTDSQMVTKKVKTVSQRTDNSLSLLTQKFIKLIKQSKDKRIDLNVAQEKLVVPKRRIYDITNVLEGIGYIEKVVKNQIKWVGSLEQDDSQQQLDELEQEIKDLEEHEKKLDGFLEQIESAIDSAQSDEKMAKYAYVTKQDMEHYEAQFPGESILLVKVPEGATLEMDDGDEDDDTIDHEDSRKQLRSTTQILIESANQEDKIQTFVISQSSSKVGSPDQMPEQSTEMSKTTDVSDYIGQPPRS